MLSFYRRLLAALDRGQRRFRPTAIAFGVIKRYSDDRGGQLTALVTFYGFLSVFPLLLLLLTLASLLLHGTKLEGDLINSALSQFPIIGGKLRSNIHSLASGNLTAAIISVLGVAWGSFGVTSSLQNASNRLWPVPLHEDLAWWPRTLKGVQILLSLLAIVVLSSVAAGMSSIGTQYFGGHSIIPRVLIFVAAIAVNFGGYLLVMWLLAPQRTRLRTLIPGTTLGAVGWTLLQALSGYLLGHRLHHASQIYGFFAVVLGLVFWLNLGAQLFLYSTELNLVIARREWPRYFFSSDPESLTN